MNGELDLAADRFQEFRKAFPEDKRQALALYRTGQAYFLLRRYDHALGPFFELIDKHGDDPLVLPAQWMVARALEETGDLRLARDFYGRLINGKTPYATDAARRVAFINKLYPPSGGKPNGGK